MALNNPLLRAVTEVCRPAGLPSVWSNCLAGWWLGGHRNTEELPFLISGAALLYLGGTTLNDVFDFEFDKVHHPARPIPSGVISWKAAWRTGLACLALGALILFGAGSVAAALGLCLVICIVAFNALHRAATFSPVLMGGCRFFLYLIGAAAGFQVSGWAVWGGLAMACYVTGAGYFSLWPFSSVPRTSGKVSKGAAEKAGSATAGEQAKPAASPLPPAPNYWPLLLLAVPLGLALVMDAGPWREPGLLLCAIFGLWLAVALRQTFWSQTPRPAVTLARLQAGIIFADWLVVADAPRQLSGAVCLSLVGATLLLQRVPSVRAEAKA